MAGLPTGLVIFLLAEVESEPDHTEAARRAIEHFDLVLSRNCQTYHGRLFKREGNRRCVAFQQARHAAWCAYGTAKALAELSPGPLKMRMAIHAGETAGDTEDYAGESLVVARRVLEAAGFGEILLTLLSAGLVKGALPVGACLRDCGLRRVNASIGPVRIFELVHPDFTKSFIAVRTAGGYADQFFFQRTSFVGRGAELRGIAKLLRRARLLTLTGDAGVGKTRLALRVAASCADRFPGGVWFSDLAPFSDADLVAETVTRTLRIHEVRGETPAATLARRIGDGGVLLLLDNCENVAEPVRLLSEYLLGQCAGLRILVTSKVKLGARDETVLEVSPLKIRSGKPAGMPGDRGKLEAVRLFVERTPISHFPFRLTRESAPNVLKICEGLDGNPLAIELAAARTDRIPVADLASSIRNLRTSRGGSRGARDQDRVVQRTIEWTIELLPPGTQEVLECLSAFGGSGSVEAVRSVCGRDEGDVDASLSELSSRGLAGEETDDHGTIRHRIAETVRRHARERLRASDRYASVRERYVRFFLSFAEEGELNFSGPTQREWLEALDREHGNIGRALAWACEDEKIAILGVRLAAAFWRYWRIRGCLSEGLKLILRLLSITETGKPDRGMPQVLYGAGILAREQGDFPAARDFSLESLAMARDLGDESAVAAALQSIGAILCNQKNFAAAQPFFEESLVLLGKLEDKRGVAMAKGYLGTLAWYRGDPAAACALALESLEIFRRLGDERNVSAGLILLGLAGTDRGDLAMARIYLEEGMKAARDLDDKEWVAWGLEGFARLACARKEYARAVSLFSAAGSFCRSFNFQFPPPAASDFEAKLAAARSAMRGEDWREAWEAGERMGIDKAILFSLSEEEEDQKK